MSYAYYLFTYSSRYILYSCRKMWLFLPACRSVYLLYYCFFHYVFAWQWESSLISNEWNNIGKRKAVFRKCCLRSHSVIVNQVKCAERRYCITGIALIACSSKETVMFAFLRNLCCTMHKMCLMKLDLIVRWSSSNSHSKHYNLSAHSCSPDFAHADEIKTQEHPEKYSVFINYKVVLYLPMLSLELSSLSSSLSFVQAAPAASSLSSESLMASSFSSSGE